MTAALGFEGRHVGSVLLSVWRVCGRAGWVGAALLIAAAALTALLLAAPLGVAWLPSAGSRRGLLIISLVVSAIVTVLFWMRLVVNVMQQNQPQLARTLPGQVRALRAALCGVALLSGAAAVAVSVSLGGPALVVLAAVLALMAVLATIFRWPLLGFGVMVLSWLAPSLESSGAVRLVLQGVQAAPELSAVLVSALSLLLLAGVVMGGGPWHAAAHRRVTAMAGAMRGDFMAQAVLRQGGAPAAGNPGLMLGRGLYGRWLHRTLRRPGASLQSRLALGLGPFLHWTGLAAGLVVAAACIALPLLVTWTSPASKGARSMGLSMVVSVPLIALATAIGWPPALWGTRREQALLSLLPGVPQGAALNGWLARHLTRQYLTIVVLLTAVCVFCIRQFGLDFQWAPAEDFVLACAALSPLMLLLLWRDWSTLPAPTGSMQALVTVALLGVGGTSWVWVSFLQGSWWTLAALSTLAFAPLGWWRWRVAMQAPAAWPVGRASGAASGGASVRAP